MRAPRLARLRQQWQDELAREHSPIRHSPAWQEARPSSPVSPGQPRGTSQRVKRALGREG